jgi:putative SOS response-associated peptidase YedK
MCNLFAIRSSAQEIAAHFATTAPDFAAGFDEVVPRSSGLIVRQTGHRRLVRSASWGFPRMTRDMRERGQEPTPVNLVANLTSPMWQDLVLDPRYRCLIVLTQFAEPDGYPGAKTRTWYRVKDAALFAWAGFCRNTPEWGPVFAGMTTDSNVLVTPLNPRMPVLLDPADYDCWLHGSIRDVIDLQFRSYPAERLEVDKTGELWVRREVKPERQMALSL